MPGRWVWDPDPIAWTVPSLELPIAWYGIFFALGLWAALTTAARWYPAPTPAAARRIVDRLSAWAIGGVILGARLGHCLLYSPWYYLTHPLDFLDIRSGGLASHGGVLGLACALLWGARRLGHPMGRVCDVAALSFAPAAVAIRLGNWMNQEIVGIPTGGEWGVLFLHPRGGELVVPRHPVQLYEAAVYALIGLALWWVARRHPDRVGSGRLVGMALTLTFSARFFLEFWKEEQASWQPAGLLLAQWLSLPLILAGVLLWYGKRKRDAAPPAEGVDVRC